MPCLFFILTVVCSLQRCADCPRQHVLLPRFDVADNVIGRYGGWHRLMGWPTFYTRLLQDHACDP